MMEYLRRNNKKILAVVGVFLMIAFIIPATYKSRAERNAMVVGKAGSAELTNTEYQQAQVAWNHLSIGGQAFGGFATEIIAERLAPSRHILHPNWREQAYREARRIVSSIDTMSYMLLLHEARQAGVQVSPEVVQRWSNIEWFQWALSERIRGRSFDMNEMGLAFRQGMGEWQQAEGSADPATHRQILSDFLMVLDYFDRAGSAARIPPAAALQQAARGRQKMALEFVRVAPEDYIAQVPGLPDEQALQEFFKQYAAVDRNTSPDGIGFRIPNQYKLQYIEIRPADFRSIVTDEDVMEAWERLPEPTTQPDDAATQPATGPATGPATQAAAKPATSPATTQAAKPATRKVLTVEIREQLRNELARRKAEDMARVAQQFLAADWPAYRAWLKDPTAKPTYSVAADYEKFEYFEALRNKLKKRDVVPRAVQIGEFKSIENLWHPSLPGDTRTDEASPFRIPPIFFEDYLKRFFEPFASEQDKQQASEARIQMLQPMQPAPLFKDIEGNLYIIRVYESQPSRAARSLDEVRDQVRSAYRQREAFRLAKDAATKLVERAKAKGGLQQAINEYPAGKFKIQVTEPFAQGFYPPLPRAFDELSLPMFFDEMLRLFPQSFPELLPNRFPSPKLLELFVSNTGASPQETPRQKMRREAAQERDRRQAAERTLRVVDQAFELYRERLRTGQERPVGVLDSPASGVVLAARLESAEPAGEDNMLNALLQGLEISLQGRLEANAAEQWFAFDQIKARTQFVPREQSERPVEQKKPSAPAPRPLGI